MYFIQTADVCELCCFHCVLQRLYHGVMQFNTSVGSKGESQPYYLPQVEEEVEISDNTAVISVPPPRFRPGDPAYILHDFNRVKSIESIEEVTDL